MFRSIFLYFRTLPARRRARRLNFAFIACPVCGRPFSYEEVMHIDPERGAACLMNTDHSGMTVCKDCQDEARRRNRETFGRDMSDPWPKGVRLFRIGGRELLAVVLTTVVLGCSADAIRTTPTDNPGLSLELLLTTPEGCKVYRFHDEYARYVAVCPRDASVTTAFDDVQSNGKTTTTTPQSLATVRR